MKVVIIDDLTPLVADMAMVAVQARHEVLAVAVKRSTDLEALARQIIDFQPNVVFLDHDLNRDQTGEDLAALMGLSKALLVGTSSAYDQAYCDRSFEDKHYLRESNKAKEDFLALIG